MLPPVGIEPRTSLLSTLLEFFTIKPHLTLFATIYIYFLDESFIRLNYSIEWTKKTSRKEIPRCWWFCWFEYVVVPNSFYWFRLLNEVRKRTHQMSLFLSVRSCLSDVSAPSTRACCQCSCQNHFWDKILWKYWYRYLFIPNIFTLKSDTLPWI